MVIAAPEQIILGHTEPRIWTPPLRELTPETSYGFAVIDWAREVLGFECDPWQRWLLIHACELLEDGRPRFRRVLVLVARQNGKTEVLVILSLYWLYHDRRKMVLGTNSKLDYAKESWLKAVERVEDTAALDEQTKVVRMAMGGESLDTVYGGRYKIAAANRRGGRSLTIDRLIVDEVREHQDWDAYNASYRAMNAVTDAQAWFISNQGDDTSEVLNKLRAQALTGEDQRFGVFEWSSPEGMDPADPEALAMANPSLGIRIMLDDIIGEAEACKAAGGEQLAEFLTEVHCRHQPLLNPALDPASWAACAQNEGLDPLRDRLAVCIDVSLDEMHATMYAAAMIDEQRVRVDVVQAWEGQRAASEMREALPGIVAEIKPKVFGWLPEGPTNSLAVVLEERPGWPPRGVEVEPIRGRATAVCMGFAEMVRAGDLEHTNDPLLNEHIAAAQKLAQGDGWRFGRKGAGPVDAAYAAAGAVHLARQMHPPRTATVRTLTW